MSEMDCEEKHRLTMEMRRIKWELPYAAEIETEETPGTETLVEDDTDERTDDPWVVVLYNDEIHTFEEVIQQLRKATGCTRQEAEEHAWTVHNEGKDAVYEGTFEKCFKVNGVLREIQLVTEIQG